MTTDTNIIQIILEYLKTLYSSKLGNQEERDKFLNKYDPPKLNQEEVNNINRSIMSNEIETVIKNLPTKKSPWPG
jgi:hypothetical protein